MASIARDRSIPLRELDVDQPPGAAARSSWWTAGAWIATVLSVGALVAAVPFLVLLDALPGAILATLSVAGALGLLAGMALAHEAASVERGDEAIAAAVATQQAEHADERVVLVVPPRHGPGVATALAEAGVEARAIEVQPPPAGVSAASPGE